MEINVDFKFELGSFVKSAKTVQDRQTGATLIANPKEKYKVLGRAYTEGLQGQRIEVAKIYYVSPLHNRLFKRDAETVYTVKESDLEVWTPPKDDDEDGRAKEIPAGGFLP